MIKELVDIAFPSKCIFCQKSPRPLCDSCLPDMRGGVDREGVHYATDLSEPVLKILSSIKDLYRVSLIPTFTLALHLSLSTVVEFAQPTLIVCPPSSRTNFRKRGFNPALEIFRKANRSKIRVTDRALKMRFQTLDQRGLGIAERLENVDGLFRSQLADERVLLVDDVLTTGATLAAAQKALEISGSTVVGKCVLAKRFDLRQHQQLKRA